MGSEMDDLIADLQHRFRVFTSSSLGQSAALKEIILQAYAAGVAANPFQFEATATLLDSRGEAIFEAYTLAPHRHAHDVPVGTVKLVLSAGHR